MRAAIAWSHDLLSPEERTLFRRLSVFSGGWTLEAAEHVCGDDDPAPEVVDGLARLVDQSLVVSRGDRFSMLETILAYARECLVAAGEEEALRARHAAFFRTFAEACEPVLRSPDQRDALERLHAEEHNLRQALEWGRDHARDEPDAGLSLAAALGWYWYVGRQIEGRAELESILTAAPDASSAVRARALQARSLALRPAGCIVHPSGEAAQAARASLELFGKGGEPVRAALSRLLLAVEGVAGDDVKGSLMLVERARGDLRDHRDAWGLALADFIEMEIRLYHDSPEAALDLGDRAAAQFDALDDDWGRSAVRLHLGIGLRLAGRTSEAGGVLLMAVDLSRGARLPNNLARSLIELGEIATHLGDAPEGDRYFGAADEIVDDLTDDTLRALVLTGRADAARLRGDFTVADDHYRRAVDRYDRAGVPRGQVRALLGSAACSLDLGLVAEARELLARVQPLVAQAADPVLEASNGEQLARLAFASDERENGLELLRDAERIRTRSRRPRSRLAQRDAGEDGGWG